MDFNPKFLEVIFEHTNEGIVIADPGNRVLAINPAFTQIMGYSADDLIGISTNIYKSGRHSEAFFIDLWNAVHDHGYWSGEMWLRKKNGEVFSEWLVICVVKNTLGEITHYISILSELNQRKASSEKVEFLAHKNPLSQLPSRANLQTLLSIHLLAREDDSKKLALFAINLDRFKNINASYGLMIGDLVLQKVADRLHQMFKNENDVVCHLNGDKFLAVRAEVSEAAGAAHLADLLLKMLSRPIILGNRSVTVTASIGISIYPDDSLKADDLIKNAETAMIEANNSAKSGYIFFTKQMNNDAKERLDLENNLRHALERNEYELHYQPVVELKTKKIASVEALIRWTHSDEKAIPPAKFIPIAEDTGLIIAITDWVLKKACEDNKAWLDAKLPVTPVAVNISSLYFRLDNFIDRVKIILEETQLPAHHLKVELTESIAVKGTDDALVKMQKLRDMGIKILLDDFGTGYSSLSYLLRLPINGLKIDQAFIQDTSTELSKNIITAIIGLSKTLKLGVIAEGVETKEQLDFLRSQDCDMIQGFYFSEAVNKEEIMKLLAKNDFEDRI